MTVQFRIAPAGKCPKRDVIAGLDIYCKTVDPGCLTDTNQIKDYIWNHKRHDNEDRTMFFYLFYGDDGTVEGFSEFAYLPENRVLVIDYLSTKERNHVLFYNFYHMALQEIEKTLNAKGQFIRYIITELSLNQANGVLIDPDSNYFRHLLSNEGFRLSKYPYYQPPLNRNEEVREFNLAFKLATIDSGEHLVLNSAQYMSIVKELYFSHYLAWYHAFPAGGGISEIIKNLPSRIEHELSKAADHEPLALIQCNLFEEGKCPKFSAESITLSRERKRHWKLIGCWVLWILLSALTFALCVILNGSTHITVACSFFTILAGIISIISSWRAHLLSQ